MASDRTETQLMYHVAPPGARSSITRHGLDWKRRDPREDWREEGDEELYPYANYLTASLAKALEFQRERNGGGILYQVDVSDLALIRDLDEDYEGSSYYTTDPIGPSRLTQL
jgi:hypothetical protein